MDSGVHAIVLRRRDVGESDRSLVLLTSELGKIEATAKGARKQGSRLAAASEPLACLYAQLARGKARTYVTEVRLEAGFRALREDYDRLQAALALAELTATVTPPEQADAEPYTLLRRSLEALATSPDVAAALVWSELQLLDLSGFAPVFGSCALTGVPLSGTPVWVSPAAGGYVSASAATGCSDRFQTTREALIGLDRTSELDAPPPRLKFSGECLRVLHKVWQHVTDQRLPAHESAVRSLSEIADA